MSLLLLLRSSVGGGGSVYPDPADVRLGTVYGPTSNLTGTLVVGSGSISDYFESATLVGGLSLLEAMDLLLAANVGVTSQTPTTESFRYVDGSLAFVTTFDVNGNRQSVVIS
jgi:hypothetical protein